MMPSLSTHISSGVAKMLLMGDSGTGKTGSLASLAKAGYHLHILDYDNGLDSLAQALRDTPDVLANVDYESLRDKLKPSPMGPVVDGIPKAFTQGVNLLDKWSDGSRPREWGANHILVLDSTTHFGNAAYNWAVAMNPSCKDPRQWYGVAQDAFENVIALLTDPAFTANVIIISHISWVERPDGTMKGYPSSIGKALGPQIPTFFNSVALCETTGVGQAVKRTIRTTPTALIDLKNPASMRMAPQLPIETGLATFFQTLNGDK